MITSHLGGRYLRQMNALLSVEPALHSRIWPVFSFIRGWRLLWMTAYVQQKKNPSLLCLVWLTSALWAGTKWVYWLGFQESYWAIEACNPQEATSWKAPHYYSRLGWWFIARMSIQLRVRLLSLESSVPFNLCCWIQQLLVVVCSWQLNLIPSLFLLRVQKKTRNRNNRCCSDKHFTVKQRGSDMGGKNTNREEDFSALDPWSMPILGSHCQVYVYQWGRDCFRHLCSASSSVN